MSASDVRSYPALDISIPVDRRPFYYLINGFLPSCLFSLLAIFFMFLPVHYPPSRLTYVLTLTLTVVAYKLWLSDKLPAMTYLSLLDTYQLTSALIILVIAFETTIVASIVEGYEHEEPLRVHAVDRVCQGLTGAVWLWLQVWFLWRAWREHYRFSSSVAHLMREDSTLIDRDQRHIVNPVERKERSVTRTRRTSLQPQNTCRKLSIGSLRKQTKARVDKFVAQETKKGEFRRSSTAPAAGPRQDLPGILRGPSSVTEDSRTAQSRECPPSPTRDPSPVGQKRMGSILRQHQMGSIKM